MSTRALISFILLITAVTMCIYQHVYNNAFFCEIDVITTAICIVSAALVCRDFRMLCVLILCVGVNMFLWTIHGAGQLMYQYRHLAGASDTLLLATICYGFYKYKYFPILPFTILIFVFYQFVTA